MKWWIGLSLAAVATTLSFAEENELPKHEEGEGLEIEPPLLIQSRGPDGLPIVATTPASPDLAKLEANLTRAQRAAASGDRLFKAGIISKMEAEERVVRVARLQAQVAAAQLEEAKAKTSEEEKTSTVVQAEETARKAAEEKHRAELEMALRNLQRQQKLLALGSGRKADVSRAEKKLAEVQSNQN